jgi:hypothetical protein
MEGMSATQEAITRAIAEGEEACVCSAILYKGKAWPGMRHGDCMEAMRRELGWTMTGKEMVGSNMFQEQGFLTSLNRYVGREEALAMHQALGIPSADPTGYRNKIMFSEDLY